MPPSTTETTTTTVLVKTARRISTSLDNDSKLWLRDPPNSSGQLEEVRIKINDKWLVLSQEFVANHPGGAVINQYKNADATQSSMPSTLAVNWPTSN
uniref:Cytochrome b5 heme-binding domain-containing protein n=1 Tax=Ditylenchus dipsaci TaxID=166011 RepID=A0A915E4L2_9BILA